MDVLKMIQTNDMLKVVLVLIGVYCFMKFYYKETLDNVSGTPPLTNAATNTVVQGDATAVPQAMVTSQTPQQTQIDKIVAGPTQLTTNDLLPKYDDANAFAKENPVSKLLQEQNFLQAGYHMGINSQIQSNKIPYLDIRSCPPIAKQIAGPWSQSSYEAPTGNSRRHFEMN